MLSANDHSASDTLHNFHHALQRAQQALQQEETRLAQLTHTVKQQQDHNNTIRDHIRGQQQQQLEALRREIARVRSLTTQHTAEVEEQERHLAELRRPREAAEAEGQRHKETQQQQQRRYLTKSAAAHAQLARWLQPQNSLSSLQSIVTQREAEVAELRRLVSTLQQQLAEVNGSHTGKRYSNEETEKLSAEEEENKGKKENKEGVETEEEEGGRGGEPSLMVLEKQLQQQQEEKERFVQECSEALSARRGELERLKFELKRLCAEVEAADAAQQAAQQQFNTALNQQSESRVMCGMCGKDIIDSFIS